MSVIDDAKSIASLIKKAGNMELYEKMINLRGEILHLEEENLQLKKDLKKLKKDQDIKNNTVYEKPYYWLKKGDDKDGPYCQKCYDDDGKLIRLQGSGNGKWHCLSCNNYVRDSSYVVPKIERARPKHGGF